MDSTASHVSLHFSPQNATSMTEPLSAQLLQYRLSRTPAPRRFNRNKTATAPPTPEQNIHGQATLTLPRTGFRPGSELIDHTTPVEAPYLLRITRRRPAPKPYSALSQTIPESTSTKQPAPFCSNSIGHAERLAKDAPSERQKTVSELAPSSSNKRDDLTLNEAICASALVKQVKYLRMVHEEDIPTSDTKEHLTTVSRLHVSETQPSSDSAEKRKLKRPAKRAPLPSAPPSTHQLTQSQDGPSSRQYSIPDDERPAKAKKRARARRLPVEELELAEKRMPYYDAPPMSDSDEADSDPVEESTQRPARRPQMTKAKTQTSKVAENRKKQIPIRTKPQSQRADYFASFKVIKRPESTNSNQMSTLKPLVVGDGFEGLERLPTGRPLLSANQRRQTRPRIAPPPKYYRSLEIVEDKSYLEVPQYEHHASGIKLEHDIAELQDDHRDPEQAASLDYFLHNHGVDVNNGVPTAEVQSVAVAAHMGLAAVAEEAGNEAEETDNLESPVVPAAVILYQCPSEGLSMNGHESAEGQISVLPNAEMPRECLDTAIVRSHKEVEESVSMLADGDTSEEPFDLTTFESHAQLQEPFADQVQLLSQTEDEEQIDLDIFRRLSDTAPVELETAEEEKERPHSTVKRTVTFSEEVRVVVDVETESEEEEEEMNSSDEERSAEPGSECDQSQKSDADDSLGEDDDAHGPEADDEDSAEDEDDDYPNGNLVARSSPELTSSGYYARGGNAAQRYLGLYQNEQESESSDGEGNAMPSEDNMMLDLDEKIDERPELPRLSQRYAYETGDMADFIDSDEEMLIATSKATSPSKEYLLQGDDIEVIELPPLARRQGRMRRQGGERARRETTIPDSEPDDLFEGHNERNVAETYGMRDEHLSSTRDGNSQVLSQASHDERSADQHDGRSSSDSTSSRPHPQSIAPISSQDSSPRGQDREHRGLYPAVYQCHLTKVAKGAVLTPTTSFAVEGEHYFVTNTGPTTGSQKIKRAKPGLAHVIPLRSSRVRHNTAATDVPSYFTQASRRLSPPFKDAVVMMRRAKTLPSTQYVSESGDEEGFIVMLGESFRRRLAGKKIHGSLSDNVDQNSDDIDLKELVKRPNEEMGRSTELKRKRSLPFKSPFKHQTIR